MTALATGRLTPQMAGSSGPMPSKLSIPVKALTKIYAGSIVAVEAGYAIPGTIATGLWCVGKAEADVDNSAGASGDLSVTVLLGAFRFENSTAGDLIAQADIGKLCYLKDDQTVALTSNSGTRSPAGMIIAVETAGVFVLMGVHNPTQLAEPPTRMASYTKAVDAAASTTLAELVIERVPSASTVIGVYFAPSAALTADDTNYATLTVSQRDGIGGAAASVAAKTTKITGGSGDWTAFVPVSLGTLTNASLIAGSVLTLTIAKAGTGVAIPSGTLVVLYTPAA